jgi:integrase
MVSFFALMYYAALRPEEATDLRKDNIISLPDEGWGEMVLTNAQPRTGSRWTDSGKPRERRPLKHRAEGETRPVPMHPDLVKILRHHLDQGWSQPGHNGRVFFGQRGGTITDRAYLPVWKNARVASLTPKEAASPLAQRPYDLRHAAVSTWLAAGVPAAQVALWAGHSVAVLLKVYAKCISGCQEDEAKRRITDATRTKRSEPPSASPTTE